MEYKQKNRVCFMGIMMMILGSTSFSNHPLIGDILVVGGMVLIIVKEVIWRRRKTN